MNFLSLFVTFIKLEFIENLFSNLLEKLLREWKLFTPTSLEFCISLFNPWKIKLVYFI